MVKKSSDNLPMVTNIARASRHAVTKATGTIESNGTNKTGVPERHQRFNELMNINWNEKIQKLNDDINFVRDKEKRHKQAMVEQPCKKVVKFSLPAEGQEGDEQV